MKNYVNYSRVNDTITIMYDDGSVDVVTRDSPKFYQVNAALKNEEYDTLVDLLSETDNQPQWEQSGVTITDNGRVMYNGTEVTGAAAEYLIQQYTDGYPIDGIPELIGRIEENPSAKVREQLFTFLIKGNNAILPDGHFLAYKRVRDNYLDCHSGTMDNSPGTEVTMPRRDVMDDPTVHCSRGLHVCSYSYLSKFAGERIVKVKVDPADVVSVPNDYNHAKMRTCRYVVLEDITEQAEGADVLRRDAEEPLTFDKLEISVGDEVYSDTYGYGIVDSMSQAVEVLWAKFEYKDSSTLRGWSFNTVVDKVLSGELDFL